MDVFKQRLEQEYGLTVIATAPSVLYKVKLTSGDMVDIESPSEFPEYLAIDTIYEPIIDATILMPSKYLGPIIKLCQDKRGDAERSQISLRRSHHFKISPTLK